MVCSIKSHSLLSSHRQLDCSGLVNFMSECFFCLLTQRKHFKPTKHAKNLKNNCRIHRSKNNSKKIENPYVKGKSYNEPKLTDDKIKVYDLNLNFQID